MRSLSRRGLLVTVVLLLGAPAVEAAPKEIKRDRSDNTFYFTYDDSDEKITNAVSSRMFVKGDPVDFLVYVRETKAKNDAPLKGMLTLRLLDDRSVRYDGTFDFVVKDPDGAIVYANPIAVDFVLRPKAGRRRVGIRYALNLDSGDYRVVGRFKQASASS